MAFFLNSDSGAVTVDWVVLTAGLVGLGLATMGVVSSGVEDLSGDTRDEMTNSMVYTTFDQRSYSDYYLAVLAHEALEPSRFADGGSQFFADDIAFYTGQSDTDLAAEAADARDVQVPLRQGRFDIVSALDPSTTTTADVAALSWNADKGKTAGDIQADIDALDGTMETYLASRAAAQSRVLEREKLIVGLADDRGLTY